MAEDARKPWPDGRRRDVPDERAAPLTPENDQTIPDHSGDGGTAAKHPEDDQTVPAAREERTWYARASVSPARAAQPGPAPPPWDQPPGQDEGRWWMPVVIGLVVLLLLGVLGYGLWLISTASEDSPGPVTPTAPAGGSREPTQEPATSPPQELIEVPDLVGASLAEAQALLRRLGLAYQVRYRQDGPDPGTVLETEPEAGSRVARGTRVRLIVAGPPPATGSPAASPTATG